MRHKIEKMITDFQDKNPTDSEIVTFSKYIYSIVNNYEKDLVNEFIQEINPFYTKAKETYKLLLEKNYKVIENNEKKIIFLMAQDEKQDKLCNFVDILSLAKELTSNNVHFILFIGFFSSNERNTIIQSHFCFKNQEN